MQQNTFQNMPHWLLNRSLAF